MKQFITKEWVRRALRTFFQAFVGYVAANLTVILTGVDMSNKDMLTSAGLGLATSAIAAGIAAVMNLHTTTAPTGVVYATDDEEEEGEM